jgi:hypothetical protein
MASEVAAQLRGAVEDEDPLVIVAQSELPLGADHAG